MKHKLDDIDKKEIFMTPEGYFEDLPLKIQQRISNESKSRKYSIPSWSLAFAASISLIITFIFILPKSGPNAEELLADIPQDELMAYLDQIDIDEYDIASVITDSAEELEFENTNVLDGIDLGDQSIEDVLLEYDLADEYL